MASACPNIKSEQWLNTVEKTSYFEAYRLFVANGFDMPPFAFKTSDDVERYLGFIKQLNKRGDVWMIPYGKDYSTYVSNTNLVTAEVNRINSIYKGLLTLKSKPVAKPNPRTPSRSKIEWVELNKQALVEYYKVYEDPIDIRKEFEDRGEIYYEQRVDGFVLSPENRKDFEEKKAKMLSTFPRVTNIIEDYTIPQAGTLESNGTVIRVNPTLWTTDTIGHEFGHLLIDTMGGMSSPLIKKARKQLIGSDIETSVKERYPDLVEAQDDRIDKEIVAQAIGEQTAKIFSEEKDRAAWKNILTRILERISKLLHINHNESRELARIVLSGESVNTDSIINIDFYEQRSEEALKEKFNKSRKGLTKIESLREDMIIALKKKKSIYTKQDYNNKLDILNKTLSSIQELDNDPIESVRLFQEFAITQTQAVYDRYSVAKRKADKFKRGEEGGEPFTLRTLARLKDYVSGFSLLSELAKYAEGIEVDTSEKATGVEKVLNKEKLSEAIRQRDAIEEAYVENGVILVSEFLAPHSKHIEAEYRDAIERDYNALPKAEKVLKSKETYIEERLGINEEEIAAQTQLKIKEELLKASKDINQLQRWLDNALDSPDAVVSAMTAAFVEADFKARQEYISVQDQMLAKVKDLETFYKDKVGITKDIKSVYAFMLEKDSKGNSTQNIVTMYKSSLWDNYNNFKKTLEDEGVNYDTIQEKLKRWKNNNMPLDQKGFNKSKEEFYKGLLSKGIITTKEKKAIDVNDHWSTQNKKDISTIVSDEAAEIIHNWFRDNVWLYRKPAKFYENPQWFKLVEMAGGNKNMPPNQQRELVKENKNNDPRLAFYNFIVTQNEKIQKDLPYGHRLHNRLPSVLKDSGERAIAGQSPTKVLKHTINSSLNVLADDTERGSKILTDEAGAPVHFIPIYYTTDLRKFYSAEYDNLSDKEKDKISETDYINNKAEENQSYDLASIYSRYFNSAINYKHKFEILPEMEMARFLVSKRITTSRDGKGNIIKEFLSKDEATSSKVRAENTANQLNDWFEALMYGIKEKDEGTLFGGRLDIGKTANTLNKFTALNLLSLNVITGTANVILGSTMQTVEAAGKQFYSPKDLAKANRIYGKNLPGILGDIATRKPTNKVSLLLRKFDVLNEYSQAEFKKNTKFRQLLSTNTLFFTSHAGEHFMQTKVLLAMLNKLQARDKQGNDLGPMVDQYSVEKGELKLNDNVANFSEEDQSLFEAKVRRLLSSIHGEYSQAGRVAVQRYALGRMAYMFRKFVIPGVRRRYQKRQVNNALGEYVEGSYRTTGRFFMTLFKDLRGFQFALMASDWASMTDMEKGNVRKTLVEFTFLMSAIILSNVFIAMKEDADDDEEWIWSFLAYQALRYKTEVGFFINPMEAMKILRSPAASMSVIENSIRLVGQMLPPDFEGFERYERGSWKGRPKIQKTAINFVPGLKQIYRVQNVADQITWLR